MPVRYPGAGDIAATSLDQDTGVVVESIRIWIAYHGLARLAGGQTGQWARNSKRVTVIW
jgi:hypothetical protein